MNDTIREAVFLYVTHNIEKIKKLIEPLKIQRSFLLKNENPVFRQEVQEQFEDAIKSCIASHLAENLQLTPEEVLSFVEDINIQELTK